MKTDEAPPENDQATKIAIVVLGMHRSGTSMLGGLLENLGCQGPKTKMKASKTNPKGYFESKPVFQLNDEILAAAGSRWDDWQPLNEAAFTAPHFDKFRARAVDLLKAEYGDAPVIYLKDPRMCRLLPLWQSAFESLGYRVVCVHTHRNPADIATSLKVRKAASIDPSLSMLVWLRHVLEAEANSRTLPRVFTSYSSLLEDWRGFVTNTAHALDITWPVEIANAEAAILDLVDPALRHHQTGADKFLADPQVPEPYRNALQVLETWAQTGEAPAGIATLQRLNHEFDLSTQYLLAPVDAVKAVSEKPAHTDQIQTLTAALATAHDRETELSAEIAVWTGRIIARDKKNADLARREHHLSLQLQTLEDTHARAVEDIHIAYQNSTSWWFSAPLRFVKNIVSTRTK